MFHFFAVWAGTRAPPKQQTKKTSPRPNSKRPFRACLFFCCSGGWACLSFAVWAGACYLFFAVLGRGMFFLPFGLGACFCFSVWAGGGGRGAGGSFVLLLFGRGTGVHSLTGLPGSSSSNPTIKKTKQQKQKKTNGFQQVW